MKSILLKDLLQFDDNELSRSKIKFNQFNGSTNPLEEYEKEPEKINNQWLFWRKQQRYFHVGQIAICLLKLTYDTWLLTTIKEVTEDLNIKNGINYKGIELEKYKQYFGRVILKYQKTHQTQGIYFSKVEDQLEVLQILPSTFDGVDFPGYDYVSLTYKQLEIIINRNKKDWVAALSNEKAVYLITDLHTGKLYVGSAYGENGMLLQRWSNYIKNGHGGNKELKELINHKGFDYVKENFQYSLLENYNSRVDTNFIINRESWWKEVLGSRRFGYNSN